MAGISNLNPPQPKYCMIWDVEQVLNLIRKWPDNASLSPKQLTLKVSMLLGLVTIDRGSELILFNIDKTHMGKCSSKYMFSLKGTVKHSRKGKPLPCVEIFEHKEEIALCPVKCLDAYIKFTKPLRNGETQLFLSHMNPHKKVSKSTITRWIKETLLLSGIDTNIYQTHSLRAASSSKVHSKGLSTMDILKHGNWSQESTWQKFYHKEVQSSARRFQNTLLKL